MNARHVYTFKLRAETPLHCGDGDGEMVQRANNQYVLPGTSIGGALRSCLKRVGASEVLGASKAFDAIIVNYMGSDKNQQEDRLTEGPLFISDGLLDGASCSLKYEEGTAIDQAWGTADPHKKYKYAYVDAHAEISFRLECEVTENENEGVASLHALRKLLEHDELGESAVNPVNPVFSSSVLELLIAIWAEGLRTGQLRFGGKKNQDFGRFSILEITRVIYRFDQVSSLDDYIFRRQEQKGEPYEPKQLEPSPFAAMSQVRFRLAGAFPYGVYQSYPAQEQDKEQSNSLSGIRRNDQGQYYLSSSSIKGVLRSELEQLIIRVTGNEALARRKGEELFGSTQSEGKLRVRPLILEAAHAQKVQVLREASKPGDERSGSTNPVYIKIDRLTGGAYSSALKEQQEIQGRGVLAYDLKLNVAADADHFYLFPLVYVLRRLGSGRIALGGRTSIGLGQFIGAKTEVQGADWRITFDNADEDLRSSEEQLSWLKRQFEAFERWCHADA